MTNKGNEAVYKHKFIVWLRQPIKISAVIDTNCTKTLRGCSYPETPTVRINTAAREKWHGNFERAPQQSNAAGIESKLALSALEWFKSKMQPAFTLVFRTICATLSILRKQLH